jgi:hypothetical protein
VNPLQKENTMRSNNEFMDQEFGRTLLWFCVLLLTAFVMAVS